MAGEARGLAASLMVLLSLSESSAVAMSEDTDENAKARTNASPEAVFIIHHSPRQSIMNSPGNYSVIREIAVSGRQAGAAT